MPIYEYQCAACGRVEEKWQKISEDPLTTCPACGGSLSKLISNCAFHLKGSGWYVTDYARKSSAPPSDSKKQESKSESKAETKSESKSESKSAKEKK